MVLCARAWEYGADCSWRVGSLDESHLACSHFRKNVPIITTGWKVNVRAISLDITTSRAANKGTLSRYSLHKACDMIQATGTPPDPKLPRHRLSRLREEMMRAKIDTLILGSPENVLYATGYESMPAAINRRYDYVAIVTARELLLVCPANDVAAATGAGMPVSDIYPFGSFYFAGNAPGSHSQLVHQSFKDAFEPAFARAAGRVTAVETDYFSASARSLLPSDAIETGGLFMLAVRAVKLPGELELMRFAAQITEEAIEAGMAMARPGVPDKQVGAVVAAHMSARGGFTRNVTVVGGLHSAYSDAFPLHRPLEEGDLLRFDVGCSYYGYKSDLGRTAVIGPASRLQQDRYEALRLGLLAEMEIIRPGMAAGDVFRAGMDRIASLGFKEFKRHHLGHAIGLAVYEHPVITPGCTDPIPDGSVFCLETPYYEPGWGGMMCEDTGVVTGDGFVPMSTINTPLRELN